MKKLPANINRLDILSWMQWITEYATTYENSRFDILHRNGVELPVPFAQGGVVNASYAPFVAACIVNSIIQLRLMVDCCTPLRNRIF